MYSRATHRYFNDLCCFAASTLAITAMSFWLGLLGLFMTYGLYVNGRDRQWLRLDQARLSQILLVLVATALLFRPWSHTLIYALLAFLPIALQNFPLAPGFSNIIRLHFAANALTVVGILVFDLEGIAASCLGVAHVLLLLRAIHIAEFRSRHEAAQP